MKDCLFEDGVSSPCINFIEKKSILVRGSVVVIVVVVGKRFMLFNRTFADVFGATTPFTFDTAGTIGGLWHSCKSEKKLKNEG